MRKRKTDGHEEAKKDEEWKEEDKEEEEEDEMKIFPERDTDGTLRVLRYDTESDALVLICERRKVTADETWFAKDCVPVVGIGDFEVLENGSQLIWKCC